MEIGNYQQKRQSNLRWALAALLLGSAFASFVAGVIRSPFVLNWLPYEPRIHTAVQWLGGGISLAAEAFGSVMLVQVIVWWMWRDVDRSKWPFGIALVTALTLGSVFSFYGSLISQLVFDQGSVYFFYPELLSQSLSVLPWILCMVAVFWVALKAAQPAFAIQLVDVSDGDVDQRVLDRKRNWSIRQLMLVTLVIAILIAIYQALFRYQQQTIGASLVAHVGWISLISTVGYCLTNLIVLWSAAIHRMGGSSLAGYAALVVATAIYLLQRFATTYLIGSTFAPPLGAQAIIGSAILVTLTFSMHLWMFRKWEQAGYQVSLRT